MTKRIISFVLAIVLAVALLPLHALPVLAATTSSGTTGNCKWTLDKSTGTLTISGYGDMADYTADAIQPWKEREYTDTGYTENAVTKVIIGKDVTSIGDYAFYESGISSIVFEESDSSRLRYIGDYAFSRNPRLTYVSMPESGSLIGIGKSAFAGCNYLNGFYIRRAEGSGDKFSYIDEGAFEMCTQLRYVYIESANSMEIREDAFRGCSNLIQISFQDGEGTVAVEDYGFSGCSSLKNFYGKVTSVGRYAFADCSSLPSIDISAVTTIKTSAFRNCSSLTSIDISSVTSIESTAFAFCRGLTSITIPAKVTSIGSSAFGGCTGLNSIIVDEGNAKYYSDGNCVISKNNKQLIFGCENSVIPSDGSVVSIGEYAFNGYSTITSIVIPDCITSIGKSAFCGCSGLESITLPFVGASRTSSEPLGYLFVNSIETVSNDKVPESLKRIEITDGDVTGTDFANCKNLTSIVIGKGVQNIATSAFSGTTALEEILVHEDNPNYSSFERKLYNKDQTKCILVPRNYKRILQVNFVYVNGDTALPSVVEKKRVNATYNVEIPEILGYSTRIDNISGKMPDSDLTIDVVYYENSRLTYGDCNDSISWTLYDDGMLILRGKGVMPDYGTGGAPWVAYAEQVQTVYIDPRISSIGSYAFENCQNMTFIDYGYSMETIGEYAFSGCSSLVSFKLPDSVTAISKGAFSKCSGLKNIVIPDNITSIEENAFTGCSDLIQVTIGGAVSEIGTNAFADCDNLTQVYFRGEPATLGSNVFGRNNGKFVYYYSSVDGWDEVITDGLWYGYTAVPYNAIAKENLNFTGTNIYIIKVVDKHNMPLASAVVTLGDMVQATNNDGMAYFVKPTETKKLTVSCNNHITFEDDTFVATTSQIMDIIELSDKPSTVQGVRLNGRSIATSVVVLNCAESKDTTIVVGGFSKYTITKYELYQGNRLIASNKTSSGNCTFKVAANAFEEGETVVVRMHTADGNMVATALNIDVVKLPSIAKDQVIAELSDVNIGAALGDLGELNFEIPFSIHGAQNISVYTEGRSIFVGINFDVNEVMSRKLSKKAIQEKIDAIVEFDKVDGNAKREVEINFGGYLEIEYLGNGDTYIKSSYVKMGVGLMLESEIHASFYGIVGVYFKVKFGASGELELHISRFDRETGFEPDQLDLTLESMLDLEGGVFLLWGAGSAGVFGNLTMGFTIGMIPTTEVKEVYVTGDLGFRWKIGWGLLSGQYSLGPKDIYRWPEESAVFMLRLYAARQNPNSYTENDRSYLDDRSPWLAGTQADGSLQENIYDNVAPKVVSCGDTTMMIWLDDNSERDDANFQMLYYSVYSDGAWSEPEAVCDNGTFDCEFDVYTDGDKVYVIYTELKEKRSVIQTLDITDSSSVEAFVGGVEVNVATYENGKFGVPVRLTENSICEQLPIITEVNGVITATWLESNYLGLGTDTSDSAIISTVLGSNGWSDPVVLVNGQNAISNITTFSLQGNAYTAYIVDADGIGSTTNDKVLVLRFENGDSIQLDTGAIANVEIASIEGSPALTWYNNGIIYMVTDVEQQPVSLVPKDVLAGIDYQVVSISDRQTLLLFTKKNQDQNANAIDGTDIYGLYIDGDGALSSPVRLTETEGYVTSYSVYAQNEVLFVVFTETLANVSEDDLETTTHLKTAKLEFCLDIAIEDVEYDIDEAQPSSDFNIRFRVANKGTIAVDGVTLNFYDHSGQLLYTADSDVIIESGTSADCEVTVVLPQSISAAVYVVEILPHNKMTIEEDSDPTNNWAELILAYTDMSVCAEQKIIGEKNYIIMSVFNDGNVPSKALLQVYAEDRLISELETNVINPDSTEQYLIDIHALTNEMDKILTCVVTSDFRDLYTLNDTDSVYLLHIENEVLTVDPDEAIRNPEISVNFAEFDKYAAEDITLEITSEADSFISIEGLTKNTDYTLNSGIVTISSDYLATLDIGMHTLNLVFDFGNDSSAVRSLTVTVRDTTPIVLTGSVSISGEAMVGSTVYADLSNLRVNASKVLCAWSIDGETVGTDISYTVRSQDSGKKLKLTVTATDGYAGIFVSEKVTTQCKPEAPSAPVVGNLGSDTIVLVRVDDLEYSLDCAAWQSSNVFTNLLPNETYTVYARRMATETNEASDISVGTTVTTRKFDTTAPFEPTLQSKSYNAITLVSNEKMEYRIEGGTWTENNIFSNLQPGTTYVFYQRYKETDSAYASEASSASFTTEELSIVSGTVVSYGATNGDVTVKLMQNGAEVVSAVTTKGIYELMVVAPEGVYQLVISKKDHATRIYEFELSGENLIQDVKIHLFGDINGDGLLNIMDVNRANAHAKKRSTLTGYDFTCADINGDGTINIMDVNRMNAHAKKRALLW